MVIRIGSRPKLVLSPLGLALVSLVAAAATRQRAAAATNLRAVEQRRGNSLQGSPDFNFMPTFSPAKSSYSRRRNTDEKTAAELRRSGCDFRKNLGAEVNGGEVCLRLRFDGKPSQVPLAPRTLKSSFCLPLGCSRNRITMEKIPAALVMEWSIELEKGLRSKCPDKRIEAIKQMASMLQALSTEPNITKAVADMYSLVPGEDRTFANTILLRLSDAFKCRDNYTRRFIVKVFLFEVDRIRKEGIRYNGILAKSRVPNYVEMLKRVKIVYDTGDTEAKTLALRLFGCWAPLAKDSAHIRYNVLLSLQSCNVPEVKASLFASGCFSMLSEDFACITLQILLNVVCSSQLSSDVTTAAIRTFSRLHCSPSIASKAYKVGKKMLMDPLHDEFKTEMLSSLSKLAFRSTILTIEQVDLLLSFLAEDTASPLKARALKCLKFIFGRITCGFAVNEGVIVKLLRIADENDDQVNLQCEALRILCKIFAKNILPEVPNVELLVLVKRVLVMAKEISFKMKTKLALRLIVHILCSLKRTERGHNCAVPVNCCLRCSSIQKNPRDEIFNSEVDTSEIACQVTLLIADHISFLISQMIANSRGEDKNMKNVISTTEFKQDVRNKLDLVQLLAREYFLAPLVVVDRIEQMLQALENMYYWSPSGSIHQEVSQKKYGVEGTELAVSDKKDSFVLEIAVYLLRFMNACIKKLNDIGALNNEVCQKVKDLVQYMQQSRYSNNATYEIFCLSLHSSVSANYQALDSHQLESDRGDDSFHNVCWLNHEWKSLELIRTMLLNGDYWAAYRAGKYACLEGLWFAATFTFRKLVNHVKSVFLFCWLKCMLLLAGSESEIKLLLFPKAGIVLVSGLQTVNNFDRSHKTFTSTMGNNSTGMDLCVWEDKFAKIYGRICSAEQTLAAPGVSDGAYCFQRWFLNLRAKFLKIVADIFRLLNTHKLRRVIPDGREGKVDFEEFTQNLSALMSGLVYESVRLHNLAKGYDLLASSFMDIDRQSYKRISAMALKCSLLSFCTAFVLHFPCSPVFKNAISTIYGRFPKFSCTMILQDLIERLSAIDDKISEQLLKIMTICCKEENHPGFDSCSSTSAHIDVFTLKVFEFAVSGILRIQEDAKGEENEMAIFSLSLCGLQHLSDIIRRWMEIPVQIPKYFFIVRPFIGAELFVFDANSSNKSEISVLQGSQVALNICIQLKNPSKIPCLQVTKMYCILAARSSEQLSSDRKEEYFNAYKIDEMVQLNDMLLMFIKVDAGRTNKMSFKSTSVDDWITACLPLQMNKNGQGFSSCLLDVSAFPVGSYQIKWHGCCTDESGSFWSLLPLTSGAFFTVKKP